MRIIPAIDIINGSCVRLSKGDYATQKIYSNNPLEMAKRFEDAGIRFLHLVDLDGAKSKQIENHKILDKIASQTNLIIDFGGGIKSEEDVKIAFNSGANQVTVGSISAQKPELMIEWLSTYGGSKIILGADCRNRKIATNGWQESAEQDVLAFIQGYQPYGLQYAIVTDIEKDGMLAGAAEELYQEILEQTQEINLIASGGVSNMNDILRLREIGCEGVIIGKAIYEGTINLKELGKLC